MSGPLEGKRIVVIRAREQAARLSERLRALGAVVIEIPVIRIVELDSAPILRAAAHLDEYALIIFTSANAVSIFLKHLSHAGRSAGVLRGLRVAAIGSATARALEREGLRPDIVPDEFRAEGLLESLEPLRISLKNRKVLLPRAKEARMLLAAALAAWGALVDDVPLYETVPVPFAENASILGELAVPPDILTFTSSSCALNFKNGLNACQFDSLRHASAAACIGPITAETARFAGFDVRIVPSTYSIEGLVDAIIDYCT